MRLRHLFALCLVASITTSCGYTFGTGLHEKGIHTIALTLVGNESYRQRLEVELAAALARELPISTDLRLAPASSADATLQVVIVDTEERTLVPGVRRPGFPAAPVREGALAAAVRMRLIHRDGRVLMERILLDRAEFRNPIGENLTSARAELAVDLARKIALSLDARALAGRSSRF